MDNYFTSDPLNISLDWNNTNTNGCNNFCLYDKQLFQYQLLAIVYTTLLMVLGIPGNIVVLYIYILKWRKSTSRIYIIFLAVLDLVNCMTTLPMEIFIMTYSLRFDYPVVCKLSRFSTYLMNTSSTLILVGIAVDRFKRICRPYDRLFSETTSKWICIASIITSLVTTSPFLLFYGTQTVKMAPDVVGKVCLLEDKYNSSLVPLVYFGVMGLTTVVIFFVLSLLYYCIGMQIYRHKKFKENNCSTVEKVISETPAEGSSNSDVNNLKPLIQLNVIGPTPEDDGTSSCLTQMANISRSITPSSSPRYCLKNKDLPSLRLNESVLSMPSNGQDLCNLVGAKTEEKSPSYTGKKIKQVRYLLVRGSSTMHSGRERRSHCMTIKVGRSTLMLFVITLAFIISFLPFYIIVIIRQAIPDLLKTMTPAGNIAYHMFLRSYLLCSAINPIIYSFCNKQFRGFVKDLLAQIVMKNHGDQINKFSHRIR
ncbi:hypothetical protein ACJMK2_037941 [Sinanodonta woodiana]|uniref:G-protein coupled receptors family 1 profile domain-containing protein n=1 Tax=Sinanodonta woodiana TaxID=1069815 RepID=A0ABD3WM14_SINWO